MAFKKYTDKNQNKDEKKSFKFKDSFTSYRKTPEEKEQKQQTMANLEKDYEKFLADRIAITKDHLLTKYPTIKTLFEGWVYGVYIAVLDYQQAEEKKGKLYFLFENTPEKTNKYKLSYNIDDKNNCTFNTIDLKDFPKPYMTIVKRHHLNLKNETISVSDFIAAHQYKFDEMSYVYHSDCNRLNNNIKNLIPLEIEQFNKLSDENKKAIAKAYQYIPEKYKTNLKNKAKETVKMEYRACDLYYNHKIPVDKIAITLRNRLKKTDVEKAVRLYNYFRIYALPAKVSPKEEA
ncbi:MAG: hypothetical protein WCK67_04355 [bacterium]